MAPKLVLFVGFLLTIAHEACSTKVPLFIFGDSNLDVGNNNYINTTTLFRANFPPYGETFFHKATGRYTNGRLFSDFITKYANLPLIPPYYEPGKYELIHGVNFASSGSGSLSGTFHGFVISLEAQLKNFKRVKKQMVKQFGKREANKLVGNGVYLFSHGSNDYLFPFVTNSTSTIFQANPPPQYVHMVVGNISSAITKLYKEGGRKFGYINVGPLNCFPIIRASNPNGECVPEIETLVGLHNIEIAKSLNKLERELQGFKYSLFNLNAVATRAINDPMKYGFKDSKTGCCGSGAFRGMPTCGRGPGPYDLCEQVGDYLFWDSVHFTEKGHRQISELIWTGHGGFTTSYSLKTLFDLN